MISYPRTLVCYCRFDKIFIFIINFYKYQNVFKCIPANIASWSGKTILMPNYWMSCSVLRWMSLVRNRKIRNMVLFSTFGLLLKFFVLDVFISLKCVWLEKNYCIVYLYTHKSQIDSFLRQKILRLIRSSDFNHL